MAISGSELRPRRGRSRLWPRLLLLAGSLLMGGVVGEVGLRLYFWHRGVARSDALELLEQAGEGPAGEVRARSVFEIVRPSAFDEIVYELRPSMYGTFRDRPFRTNSRGLRGPEVTPRKPGGTFRIVGLGDSHMFGWGVAQDEVYLSLLQERLEAAAAGTGRRYEVLNFGAPGYNTAIEVATYELRARRFDPDLVILHFVGNDLGLPHHLQAPRSAAPADWFLVELLRGVFGARGGDGELELLPHDLRQVSKDVRRGARGRYQYMLGPAGFRRAMSRLAELTRADGVPVIVMMLVARDLVAEAAEQHGFAVLDAAPEFARQIELAGREVTLPVWREMVRLPGDGHPTPFAHRAYAEALYRELVRLGIGPSERAAPSRTAAAAG